MKFGEIIRNKRKANKNLDPKILVPKVFEESPNVSKSRISNETSQSSDHSLVKQGRKNNLVRNVAKISQHDSSYDSQKLDRHVKEFPENISNKYEYTYEYYFPKDQEHLDDLMRDVKTKLYRVALPFYSDLFDKGKDYDNSECFVFENLSQHSTALNIIYFMNAYRHYLYETLYYN